MAAAVLMFTLLFAGLAEFGRVLIAREQARTAADAASLAASYSDVMRWVNVDIKTDRGEKVVCDEFGCWCESCGTVTVNKTGLERDLIDRRGWRDYCAPPCSCSDTVDCWYEIKDRWVEYNQSSSRETADAFLALNLPDQGENIWLSRGSPIVHGDRSDKYFPSVVVYAKTEVRSLFPGLFGVFSDRYTTEVCSQSGTFYYDPNADKWRKPPPDACWEDLQ